MATKTDRNEAANCLLVGYPAHGVAFPHDGQDLPSRINAGGKVYVKGPEADRPERWVAVYYVDSLHSHVRPDWLAGAEKKARSSR